VAGLYRRESLHPTPVTRYFLTNHYTPSDSVQEIALLDQKISKAGLRISIAPERKVEYILDEKDLSNRLRRPHETINEPRVVHDVDCMAAILTLRAGKTATDLERAKVVFLTTTAKLVATVRKWYEDNDGSGIAPVVYYRAAANLAWVKNPAYAGDLKLHEIIALCRAALQPRPETWDRFLRYLRELEASGEVTSDEVAAVIASELTDQVLFAAEEDGDVEAEDLREVVERVKESFREKAQQEVRAASQEAEAMVRQEPTARLTAEEASDQLERRLTTVERRMGTFAGSIADLAARVTIWMLLIFLVLGAMATLPGAINVLSGWLVAVAYVAAAAFVGFSIFGLSRGWYLARWQRALSTKIRSWLMLKVFEQED
jgi:hypothetical protein